MNDFLNPQPYSMAEADPFRAWNPYEGVPGGMIGQGVAGLVGSQIGGSYPIHLGFQHSGSLYNNIEQQRYITAHTNAVQHMQLAQRDIYMDMARGVAAVNGTKWSNEQENYYKGLAHSAANVSTQLAIYNPALVDAASGGRSPQVLAHYMHQAGRYRDDPVTGFSSVSAQSAAGQAFGVFQHFYGDQFQDGRLVDPGAVSWRHRASGLSTDNLGNLVHEMSVRGQISGGRGGVDTNDVGQVQTAAERDTSSVIQSIEKKIKAVGAMKEIFGENGKPNAPMRELLDAIESFTGGSQLWEPARLEGLVRNMSNAARGAGLTLQGAGFMMERQQQELQNRGMNTVWAHDATIFGLNTREALMRSGAGGIVGWNRMNVDQLANYAGDRFARGGESEISNRLGALSRMAEYYGVNDSTPEGKRIKAMLAEASSGNMTSETYQLLRGDRNDLYKLATGGITGLTGSEVSAEFENMRESNKHQVHRKGLSYANSEAQRFEFIEDIVKGKRTRAYGQTAGRVREMLGGVGDSGVMTEFVTSALAEAYMSEGNQANLNNMEASAVYGSDFLRQKLRAVQPGDPNYAAAQRLLQDPKALQRLANQQYSMANEDAVALGMVSGSMGNTASTFDAKGQRAAMYRTRVESNAQAAVTGVQNGDPVMRGVMAIYQAAYGKEKDANMVTVLGNMIGKDMRGEAVDQLRGELVALEKLQDEIDKESQDLAKMDPSSEGYKTKQQTLDAKSKVLSEQLSKVYSTINSNDAIKAKVEGYIEDKDAAASGGETQQLSFAINNLVINGTKVIEDARGKTTGKTGKRGGT